MIRKVVSIVLVLLCMGMIFGFSNDTGQKSSSLTTKVIKTCINIFSKNKTEEAIDELVSKYSFLVRKGAHFIEYFILGLLVINMLYSFEINYKYIIISIIICCLYAVLDEVHQYFVNGRVCSIKDMLLDTSGATLAISIVGSYFINRGKHEKRNN